MRVILAKTYGFCEGVKRAIKIARKQEKENKGNPVFILKEIVHNPQVVEDLARKGLKSVKSLKEIPAGATIIFSAHGVSPQVFRQAQKRGLKIIDATCPLVLKVHAIAKKLAGQGYKIIYLGDPRHDEVLGVMGEDIQNIIPINPNFFTKTQNLKGKLRLVKNNKIAVITQTTLSTKDTQKAIDSLRAVFPKILIYNTICHATTERQQAVVDLVKKVQAIVVIGGKRSANTKRLWEIARNFGKKAYSIENAKNLHNEWFDDVDKVGITAGASTPDWVTQEVLDKLESLNY